MKSKIYIYSLLLMCIFTTCKKKKTYLDGYVYDLGSGKPLPHMLVKLIRIPYGVVTDDETRTDDNGYYKFEFRQDTDQPYRVKADDTVQFDRIWKFKAMTPSGNGDGEPLNGTGEQHINLYLGRLASFDSLIFETDIPFVKGDNLQIEVSDDYNFNWEGEGLSPGEFRLINKDSLYYIDFLGTGHDVLANSNHTYVKVSGTLSYNKIDFKDTILIPSNKIRQIIRKHLK